MVRQGPPDESPKLIDLSGPGKEKPVHSDALAEFHSEADWGEEVPASAPRPTPPRTSPNRAAGVSFPARAGTRTSPYMWIVVLLAGIAIAEAPFVAMWIWERAGSSAGTNNAEAAAYGTVHVETEPAGMEVWVNGRAAGRTPTQLSIPVGAAEIRLRDGDRVHTVPLTIAPEEIIRLRVELPASSDESVGLSDSTTGSSPNMVVVPTQAEETIALVRPSSSR